MTLLAPPEKLPYAFPRFPETGRTEEDWLFIQRTNEHLLRCLQIQRERTRQTEITAQDYWGKFVKELEWNMALRRPGFLRAALTFFLLRWECWDEG